MISQHKLFQTSALVLLWEKQEIYTSSLSQTYYKHINLEEGKTLHSSIEEISPLIGKTVWLRKFLIKKLILESLKSNPSLQIVTLAAGLSPLCLEVASYFPECDIYELDRDNMEEKKEILDKMSFQNNIKCISSDLSHAGNTFKNLSLNGWKPQNPSLFVLEGISYYLEKDEVFNLLSACVKTQNNEVVMDYLVPYEGFSEEKRDVFREGFSKIFEIASLEGEPTRFSREDLKGFFKKSFHENSNLRFWSFSEIERLAKNKNQDFLKDESGWIEICHYKT